MDIIESLYISIFLEDGIDQLDILYLSQKSQTPGFGISTNETSNKSRKVERYKLRNLLDKTNNEILERNSYNILVKFLKRQMLNFSFLEKIDSQHEHGIEIDQVRSEIEKLKKQNEEELWKRKAICAHLKDTIQEMKFKFSKEKSYILKSTDVDVKMVQKRWKMEESSYNESLEEMKLKFDDENLINAEMSSFLREYTKKQKDKLEVWIIKSNEKISEKQKELESLKASRARDSEKLRELLVNYHEYEKVVVDDRVEKEKMKMKLQSEAKQHQTATKIQSWWRGTLVRRQLGPYKPKSKKGKKGVNNIKKTSKKK